MSSAKGHIDECVVEQVKTSSLKPFPGNPRTISRDMLGKLSDSLQEHGFVNPLVIDEQNRIVGGYQRYRAGKKLGFKTMPCVRVDFDGDERQAKLLNIRLNKIQGEFDYEILFDFLKDFDHTMLSQAGFSDDDIEEAQKMMSQIDDEIAKNRKESVETKAVSFEATVIKNRTDFKFGSFRVKAPNDRFDKFMMIYDTLMAKKIIVSEQTYLDWLIRLAYAKMKQL